MVIVDILLLAAEIGSDSTGLTERVRVSLPSTRLSSIMDTLKSKLVLAAHGGIVIN